MKIKMILPLLLLLALIGINPAIAGIVGSKHDLSMSGGGLTGGIAAVSEKRICIFCHTPHNSFNNAPLWNRTAGVVQQYTPYSSSTLTATPGQPTGSSILCLSCHDGTIAIGGAVATGAILMNGVSATGAIPTGSKGYIGINLSNDHPISFQYTKTLAAQATELVDPATLVGAVRLDGNSEIQCTTCHDAHDDINGQFLVMSNRGSALCEQCHQKSQWANSKHNTSTNTWNGQPPDPWPNSTFPTVADNACANCHAAHNAKFPERLMTQPTEQDVCFVCHNGNVTGDVTAEFLLASAHPMGPNNGLPGRTGSDVNHQPYPVERSPVPANLRHVECVDCHNAHAASQDPVGVVGLTGLTWTGIEVSPITAKEELCFKCHTFRPTPLLSRNKQENDVRLEFDPLNPSFHPIRGLAKIGSQSLLPPWIPALLVAGVTPGPGLNTFTKTCFECHLDKPHGTTSSALLKLNLVITDGTPESPTAYELCYSCHDRIIILGDTTFREHNRHIVGETTACTTCHTPHGASLAAGATITNNLRLINFRTSGTMPVTPVGGVLAWTGTGNNTGMCTLSCHGEIHNPETY
ncbi:MAG: cytochrome c3 family protein [Gammaproteobacteria bacterium]